MVRHLDAIVAIERIAGLAALAVVQRCLGKTEVRLRRWDMNPNAAWIAGATAAKARRQRTGREKRRVKRAEAILRPIIAGRRHRHVDPVRMFFARHQSEMRQARKRQLVGIAGNARDRRVDGRDGRIRHAATDEHRIRQQHVTDVRHRPGVGDLKSELARPAGLARCRTDLLDDDIRAAFGAGFGVAERMFQHSAVAKR